MKASYVFFFIFIKYSTHHSLSANTDFKSLAFILFEILHLQNCDVKFQNFQRAITKNQRTNGPVNAHLIPWPSKAQNIQNLEKYMVKK